MLKVALVGVGGISGAHIPAWEHMKDVELVALCDIRPEMMEKYPDKRHYTDIDEMLEKEQPDILDICLPTYLHADISIKALNKGINVLCEKPISLCEEDVARVYEAAEKNNVKFMVAHVLRFWPAYELLKHIYDNGTYGKLLSGVMSRLNHIPGWSWDGWMRDEQRSGLTPFDLHIHDLDFLVYAFGKPCDVTIDRSKRPEQDYFCATYRFPEGFFVHAESSWYASEAYPFSFMFRFQFEQAVITYENGALTAYLANGEKKSLNCETAGDATVLGLPSTDAYGNEIRYFTDCVKENKPVEKVKADEMETVLKYLQKI